MKIKPQASYVSQEQLESWIERRKTTHPVISFDWNVVAATFLGLVGGIAIMQSLELEQARIAIEDSRLIRLEITSITPDIATGSDACDSSYPYVTNFINPVSGMSYSYACREFGKVGDSIQVPVRLFNSGE